MFGIVLLLGGWSPVQAQAREMRLGTGVAAGGQRVNLPIELIASGGETAAGFSLSYNPSLLTNPVVSLGSGAAGATFLINQLSVGSGRLGIVLTLPIGQRFSAGRWHLLTLSLTVASGTAAQNLAVSFSDQPVTREVSNEQATPLPVNYVAGGVIVDPTFSLTITPDPPTPADDIRIEVRGTWNDGCIPGNPVFSRDGSRLRLATSNSGQACTAALTPYTVSATIGKLPAGSYTLEVPFTLPTRTVTLGSRSLTVLGLLTTVNAANYADAPLAAESIVAGFGVDLATSIQPATTQPLPTTLAGTTIRVRDAIGVERLAPLFFVSPQQINYQIPPGTVAGRAQVTVSTASGLQAGGTITVQQVSPGVFSADGSGRGLPAGYALRVRSGAQPVGEQLWQATSTGLVPIPLDLGPETDQIFLVLFGTGMRYRSSLANITARIGGVSAEVLYAGEAPGFVGLDQCNVRLPRSLAGRGAVDVELIVDGRTANTVRLTVK